MQSIVDIAIIIDSAFVVAPVAGHLGWDIYDDYAWLVMALLLPLSWLVNRLFTRPVSSIIKKMFN